MDKVSESWQYFSKNPFGWECLNVYQRESYPCVRLRLGQNQKTMKYMISFWKNYYRLRFSPAVATDVKEAGRNPKRVQREVRKQIQNTGIGTKSQQALKLQQEQLKTERKIVSRKQRETEKQRQFELKQQKRKEKHRGR